MSHRLCLKLGCLFYFLVLKKTTIAMAVAATSQCPQGFDSFSWESCKNRNITDEDLQKVAAELSVDKVKSCLSISPEDVPQGMYVNTESVLKLWKIKNEEPKWSELIVCLNTLGDSSLMQWIAQYVRASNKVRGRYFLRLTCTYIIM